MLERALALLKKHEEEPALDALLDAWRGKQLVDTANLIDRLSARLTFVLPPSKNAKEHLAAWLALAKVSKKRTPTSAEIGSLLAAIPWPASWSDAMPIIRALVKLPHDPRVVMALVRVLDEARYTTETSGPFYKALFMYVEEKPDLRAKPALDAQLNRRKWRLYHRGSPHQREREAARFYGEIAEVNAASFEASAAERALLDELAVLLPGGAAAAASTSTSVASPGNERDALLAAIYAAPEDDGPREVYADWLSERADPQGEFISLQLAHHRSIGTTTPPTDAALRREASLLKAHASTWLGLLGRSIAKASPVFERGFLAEARLDVTSGNGNIIARVFGEDAAWSTLHTVDVGRLGDDVDVLLALPAMQSLRALHRVSEQALAKVIASSIGSSSSPTTPPRTFPKIVELDVSLDWRITPELTERRAVILAEHAHRVFPNVRRLGFDGAPPNGAWFLEMPLAKRATERITIRYPYHPLSALVRLINKMGLKPAEVVSVDSNASRTTWRFILSRDEAGQLTKLHAQSDTGLRTAPSSGLERIFRDFEPAALTEIVVDRPRAGASYNERTILSLERSLEKHAEHLKQIAVSWDRPKSAVVVPGAARAPTHT